MKYLLVFACIFSIAPYLQAQNNVGIGTNTPAEKLTIVNGQILLSRGLPDSNNIIFSMPNQVFPTAETEGIKFRVANVDRAFIGYLSSAVVNASGLRLSGNGTNSSDLTINGSGNVGIGTSQATEKFQVNGNALIDNGGHLYVAKLDGLKTVEIKPTESGSDGASILLYNSAGAVKIELDADYADGDGRVITSEIQINGGSDLAENFDIHTDDIHRMLPGMLVSIDPENEGKLTLTKSAQDKKVVGVISGANGIKAGMIMGQQESVADGKYPIALAGRVYVLATDEDGAISAGDFLTSASKPGYAKRVKNITATQGAIIGKAMGKADPVTGFVLVLINLQ